MSTRHDIATRKHADYAPDYNSQSCQLDANAQPWEDARIQI
jgi:hypothetical protein